MTTKAEPGASEPGVLRGPEKAPTGITGFDEITNGGLPRGSTDARDGGRGLGKDHVRHRVPGPGCPGLRRARGDARLRGGPGRPGHQRGLPRLRPRAARARRPAGDRRLPARPRRDRRDGLLRPRGAVHPAPDGRRVGGRQARRARHDRAAVQRPPERGHHPRRARPPVPLAQGARPHRRDHRRAGQAGQPDAVRHRGVRLGLRGHPGPPGHRRDLHPASARGEVPRVAARHQRVPLPDHRAGPGGRADHLGRPDLRGLERARVQRYPEARRDAARAASTAGRR